MQTIITEIQALDVLFDCEVYHVASGGVGGAEGSVSLLVICEDGDEFQNLDTFMQEISQEPLYIPNKD